MLKKAKFIFILCFAAIVGTYYVISTQGNLSIKTNLLYYFFSLDIILVALMLIIVIRKLIDTWLMRNKKSARLYRQTIFLFSFVAVMPTIILFFFNYFFLNKAVDSWFGTPVRIALTSSKQVTDSYIKEAENNLIQIAEFLVDQLRPHMRDFVNNPSDLNEILGNIHSSSTNEILIFDGNYNVIAKSAMTLALAFEETSYENFKKAAFSDAPVVIRKDDRLRVLRCLDRDTSTFIYLGKILDPGIVQNINATNTALSTFKTLEGQKLDLQFTAILTLGILSLFLILISIWFGFNIANRLMSPITKLIDAAQKVKQGDWTVRVRDVRLKNELSAFIHTFNMMLDHIYEQHKVILQEKNITETIIESVSAAIIGFDKKGLIFMANDRAKHLLDEDITGKRIDQISFEFVNVFDDFIKKGLNHTNYKITLNLKNRVRTMQVYLGVQKGTEDRYIATFDDVTDLLAAQKKASWTDIAQRIAHEIKNPLTPIQLSAERLKRRCLDSIDQENKAIFQDCIDVIIRQVNTIFDLVKQFTAFTRAAAPNLHITELVESFRKMITFFSQSHENIKFSFTHSANKIEWPVEQQQIQQALMNLINNAIGALEENNIQDPTIHVSLRKENEMLILMVEDNGPGFPPDIVHKITEPYVTGRKNGTGLGLAIVEKIIHDHKGMMYFEKSRLLTGACVRIIFEPQIRGRHA